MSLRNLKKCTARARRRNPTPAGVRRMTGNDFEEDSMRKTVWLAFAAFLAASTAFAQDSKAVNDALMKKENDLMVALQKKDFATFKKPIMAGAWSVDEGGYMAIDELVKMFADPKANFMWTYKVSDMKVIDIDANAKAVTYTVDQKGSFMGQPMPTKVYATTIWANHGGTWMAVFHQESTAAPAQPKK